ncbi:MAG: outer membrane beta-barrel protein [Lentisphaerae bacterium]|nr:outer membrane beta-barrel protein [Lentisphaerota bacterium]
MMKPNLIALVIILGLAAMAATGPAQAEQSPHQFGLGAHYWTAVKSIDANNVDKNGFSYLLSYRYHYDWLGLEADVEWFQKGFGGAAKNVYQPQAYLILGKIIYAAAGIGGYYSDGELSDKPFYAFRAGLDLPLLGILHLDINANYRFEDWDDLSTEGKGISADTVTVGAAARLAF